MASANTNTNTNKTGSKNNTATNNSKKKTSSMNNKKNDSVSAGGAGYYTRNIPALVLIGIFLFFIMFQFLKSHKYKNNRLRQRIDAEIRKKLYYADEYY